jgi:AAA15 family ATPase/GTPase
MAGPIVETLRAGRALVVDELSARLHPRLAGHLIKLFQDPGTNRRGAQLIFNSHDPTILGSYAPVRLHRDQVWFTEKLEEGATRLFPLTEYRIRDGIDNVERQYLLGKFGAVPFVDETFLASMAEG